MRRQFMMRRQFIEKIAYKKFKQYGLTGWKFEFDYAKSRLGRCSYRKKIVSMSKEFVKNNNLNHIYNVLKHEIAHARVGRSLGHRHPTYVNMCRAMGCHAGANYDKEIKLVERAFIGVCPKCKREWRRHRRQLGGYCVKCDRTIKWSRV